MKAINVLSLAVLGAIFPPSSARADLPFVTLVNSGDPAPGVPDNAQFSGLGPASSDPGGSRVSFATSLQGVNITSPNDTGVFSGPATAPTLVVQEGDPVPNSGDTFRFLSSPTTNRAGTIVFRSTLLPSGTAIFRKPGTGSLQTLARTGTFVDNSSTVLIGNAIYGDRISVDAADNVYFNAELAGSSVTDNRYAVLRANSSGVSTIARTGITEPPGTEAEPTVRFNVFYSVTANDSGQVAFIAELHNASPSANWGIWGWSDGTLRKIVRKGDAVPGLPGVTFAEQNYAVSIGDDGTVGFTCTLVGAGVIGDNADSLWTEKSGVFKLIVREGDPAPELDPGVVFASTMLPSNGIAPAISPNGSVAFLARVRGPGITATNDDTLWVQDGNGNLRLVVREGSLVVVPTWGSVGIGTSSPDFLSIYLDSFDGFSTSNRLLFAAASDTGNFYGIYQVDVPGDTVAPAVPINGPGVRTSRKALLRLTGLASDRNGVSRVEVKVGSGVYRRASGTSRWSFTARLQSRTSRLEVRAIDRSGNASKVAMVTIRYNRLR